MHRQLALAAIACLGAAGCAKDSAIMAGDPFMAPAHDDSAQHALPASQKVYGAVMTPPTVDENGVIGVDFEVTESSK